MGVWGALRVTIRPARDGGEGVEMSDVMKTLVKAMDDAQARVEARIVAEFPVGQMCEFSGPKGQRQELVTGHAGEMIEFGATRRSWQNVKKVR